MASTRQIDHQEHVLKNTSLPVCPHIAWSKKADDAWIDVD